MKRSVIILMVILVMLILVSGAGFTANDDLASKIKKADSLFNQWDNPENLKQALAIYEELLAKNPTNYEVLWKTVRCYEKVGKGSAKPLETFEKAKALAEKIVQIYPDKVEGHYWLASLIGRVGEEKGILNSLFMVKPMKTELDRCIAIDPKFPDAYYVLGLLYWKVPGFPVSIGDKKKAVEYAAKAVSLDQTNYAFQFGLYEAYDAIGKDKEAKAVLEHILKMPVTTDNAADANDFKKRATEALKK